MPFITNDARTTKRGEERSMTRELEKAGEKNRFGVYGIVSWKFDRMSFISKLKNRRHCSAPAIDSVKMVSNNFEQP